MAGYVINAYQNGGGNAANLFDNSQSTYAYWNSSTNFVDITITSDFRIWGYSTTYPSYDSSLIFINYSTGLIVSNTVNGPTRNGNSWKLSSSTIPAGRYKIKVNNYSTYCGSRTVSQCGYPLEQRVDNEWFIEKVN